MRPDPPAWMSAEARRIWDGTLDDLEAKGRDDWPDRESLAVYCNAVVTHAQAAQLVDQTNVLLKGTEGNLVRNPANAVVREAAATIARFARQFGLTPAVALVAPTGRRVARTRNTRAAERTIAALRRVGRLDGADDAMVALTRTLAQALDLIDPAEFPAQLASVARAQLATLGRLRGVNDDDDRGLDDFLAHLSAPMGDAPED